MSADIMALRAQVAALERTSRAGPGRWLPFGLPALDAGLPGGGLALGAVHELFAGGTATEHGAAPALFAAGVLARHPGQVLWITTRGDLYPPALARAGLDPARLLLVEAGGGALQVMEESLRHPGLAGVVCEHEGRLDLVASRRLLLAAESAGALGFLLRRPRRDDLTLTAPSAAETRWRITGLPSPPPASPPPASPPPASHAPDVPGLGRPLWRLELLRCRGRAGFNLVVESPDAQGRLAVPAGLADRPLAPAHPRRAAGGAAAGHARA